MSATWAIVIPFEFRHGLIWVKLVSAGQSLNFVLDSGAGSTVLNIETAKRLRLKLGDSQSVRAVQGNIASYKVDGFNADFDGIPIRADVLALDLSRASQACGRRIDGLLGQDFFRGRIVQIDFASKCLRLNEKSDPCCCASLPLKFCNDVMLVPVCVDGSKPRWTRLDTGCDVGLLWASGLPRATKATRVSVGISQANGTGICCATVQLGDERVPDVKIALHGSEIFPGESGLLGNGVLSRYRVTIDAITRHVFLAKL
jgi:predicted aspartyl protease